MIEGGRRADAVGWSCSVCPGGKVPLRIMQVAKYMLNGRLPIDSRPHFNDLQQWASLDGGCLLSGIQVNDI